MKKSLIKVTVALGIILGGLVPFSYVLDINDTAVACGTSDKDGEGSSSNKGNES